MPRFRTIAVLAAVTLFSGVVMARQPGALAQDATPAADDVGMGGIAFTLVGFVPAAALPGSADMEVARLELAPAAGFPISSSDPTGALVIVEAGSLTILVEEQAWMVSRGAALAEAMASPAAGTDLFGSSVEEVSIGDEATLRAGDVAFVPGGVSGEVRNGGQEPVTALLILIGPSGMMGEATPAP